MRILIDTDVLLDVALAREPHLAASVAVLEWAQSGGEAAVAWHSLTNCSYLLKGGRSFLRNLLQIVEVPDVGTRDAEWAVESPMTDLEDAFQAATALAWKADFIVTRNLRDYRKSPVPAISPAAFRKKVTTG
jgi:predicted nucleic acid-binding protein